MKSGDPFDYTFKEMEGVKMEESKLDYFDVNVLWIEKTQRYVWEAYGDVSIQSKHGFKSSFDCKKDWEQFASKYFIENWEWREV